MRNSIVLMVALAVYSGPSFAKKQQVNRYICSQVEHSIATIREEQRKTNSGRRADQLTKELREYRELDKRCGKAKFR